MFKKLKDKLAEEVKSSPQRIQQFAQAAQAAVTSASSSISDITNSDLFSIGDNENHNQQSQSGIVQPSANSNNAFQDVSLKQSLLENNTDFMDYAPHNIIENQRQRRLSNSSFASDVSFRLPNYESPSMYHLQSDMEVSASEAEDRSLSVGSVSLDRVTKEQLYAVYRRTQERYKKYRSQYGDLARHYKLLERENAKARSVLVETQDKALRRISELKEQCTLEQSAKAHLEKALRIEKEEQNMKIEALNTKIKLLQEGNEKAIHSFEANDTYTGNDNSEQLIDLSSEDSKKQTDLQLSTIEITNLNNKLEKMEQLLNKYKESLKTTKDKNAQLAAELQIASNELENKNKEIEDLKTDSIHLAESNKKIQELNEINENLQNKINSYDFTKTKKLSVLEIELQKAQNEITELLGKIEVFTKREEEYAISLAENKLSIHKELESKEKEIKALKDSLSSSQKETQSLSIIVSDYKNCISSLEDERCKLNNEIAEINSTKNSITQLQSQLQELSQKYISLEQSKTKLDEEHKCLQLQMKQETAEKLAMIDRNEYLSNRNAQLSAEIDKRNSQISVLENTLQTLKNKESLELEEHWTAERNKMFEEIDNWKAKCKSLETEINDERSELVKLQSEIENLLANHENTQIQNSELHNVIKDLKSEISNLQHDLINYQTLKKACYDLQNKVRELKTTVHNINQETNMFKKDTSEIIKTIGSQLNTQYKVVLENFEKLNTEYNILQRKLKEMTEDESTVSQKFKILQEEKNKLNSEINEYVAQNDLCNETINDISEKYKSSVKEFNNLKTEHKITAEKLKALEAEYDCLQDKVKNDTVQFLSMIEKVASLEHENQNLVKNMKCNEGKELWLISELEKVKNEREKIQKDFDNVTKDHDELASKLKQSDDTKKYMSALEEQIVILQGENLSLKSTSESGADVIKTLEAEIEKLRESEAKLEEDKKNLNSSMEKLMCQQIHGTQIKKNEKVQANDFITQEKADTSPEKTHSIVKKQYNVDMSELKNIEEEYISKTEFDILREENKRLNSDIEGLQTYLRKISKENSLLNDKLRESIASSENSPEKSEEHTGELTNLENEVKITQEKLDHLSRENTFLVEENLELKDQLQSQNYDLNKSKGSENEELFSLKAKYDSLFANKKELDQKLNNLEAMNNSINRNMQEMQVSNEKYKLSNEKLARRLDEALVSLRHIHSLQENTELEYLKNILYEYLTGSGTHSVTLAKVLSAIVKFDDTQTQIVLQKEKERQGLLRQLGLM